MKNTELRSLLWQLITSHMPVFATGQCYEAVVKSVDTDNLTCEVYTQDEPDVTTTARLTSVIDSMESYFVIIPAEGSTVLVQVLRNDSEDVAVCSVRDVLEVRFKIGQMMFKSTADGHVFNGGELGGMCITPELFSQLGKMSKRIDTIENAIKNSAVAGGDGGAAFKAAMIGTIEANTEKENFDNIENDKVKH